MSDESTNAPGGATSGTAHREPSSSAAPTPAECLCLGLGPQLTQALRALLAVDGVSKALHDAELDALKLLRSLIDQRIASLGATPTDGRGMKVSIA
ncbi:MAG: hypothetical protein AB7I50_19935 [Vicinamibacterales bacterium]